MVALTPIIAPVIARQSTAAPLSAANGGVRLILRLEAAAVLAIAAAAYARLGAGWGQFALLFLTPDLSMLGYLAGPRIGAAAYNLAHSYATPLALAAAALALGRTDLAPLTLIWVAHIGFDRLLGYGLKYATAFGDTHLGRVGRG